MEQNNPIIPTNLKNPISKNISLFTLTPKRKQSQEEYSPKKIKNLLKRESEAGKPFLNPSRFQKMLKKEQDLLNKRSSIHNLQISKKEFEDEIENIKKDIIDKYRNPYMEYLYKGKYFFAGFVKNQKPTYYNYFQTNYILDKTKCSLYANYKDHKLFLDNQEYCLKLFTKRESKVYLHYLLYFTYEKDHYVKSDKTYCVNKDRKHMEDEYKDIIIDNIFGAHKILYIKNLEKIPVFYNKSNKNVDPKLYDKKQIKKLTKISIPKYYLNIKPVISDINYLFIKDVPNIKIPNIIPNYCPNDLCICYILKNIILKNKNSIYMINYKECFYDKNHKKKSQSNNSNKSKDNINIINSFITNDSKNNELTSDKNILNITKLYNTENKRNIHNVHSAFRRLKNDIDIVEMENLVKKIINTENKTNENEPILDDIEILNNNENEKEIFLSTLKKPFIGNRTRIEKIEKISEKGNISLKSEKSEDLSKKIDITKSIHEKIQFLKMKNEEMRKKHPLHLYIDDLGNKKNKNVFNLFLNFYDLEDNKETNYKKHHGKNMLHSYFPDRFLNSKKYREYLINSPFLKALQKMETGETHIPTYSLKKRNKTFIKLMKSKKHIKNIIKEKSFSPNQNIYTFKQTYKFLLGMKKKENKNYLRQNIFNKTNTFYQQFKTLNFATKNRSNFKKSGAFAFSSFSGSNYDQTENEWKESADIELQNSYFNSFFASNLMKKIQSDYKRKLTTLKSCTTFKEIAKCPNIYV